MRIIYIGKSRLDEDVISNSLNALSEQDSIAFFYNYFEATNFINNNIIPNQISLDLIILENNIRNLKATEFYQSIIKDKSRTFSDYNFNFYSIPVILITDFDENPNAFMSYGFYDVISNIGYDKLHVFVQRFRSSIKTWRKKVLDELDHLGIRFNSGTIDYTYYFSQERKKNIETSILSENFKNFPRKLDYDWLSTNDKQIEIAIDDFKRQLKTMFVTSLIKH